MRRVSLALIALFAGLSGCGYSLVTASGVPSEVRSVHVERVDVGDGDPRLADALTRELREEMRRRGRFVLVDGTASADAVLSVHITLDRTRALAFDEFDDVLDYQSTLAVDAELARAGGEVIWSETDIASSRGHAAVAGAVVTSTASFQATERLDARDLATFDGVQLGEERKLQARERLVSDLAASIYSRMVEGF